MDVVVDEKEKECNRVMSYSEQKKRALRWAKTQAFLKIVRVKNDV